MKFASKFAAAVIIASAFLAACSKSPQPVKFDTLEDARAQARTNAEFNAAAYLAALKQMPVS